MAQESESFSLLHAGILVSDMGKSSEFYEGLLGWTRDPRPEMGFGGAWYKIGQGQLHLMEAEESEDIPRKGKTRLPGRDGHFAVKIPDFARVMPEPIPP